MKKGNVTLQKGNLYNPLTGYFDFNLLNSSEYDLEITINEKKEYFRIRYIDFHYVASPIANLNNYEFYKSKIGAKCSKEEILEFRKSDFYQKEYAGKKEVEMNVKKKGKYISTESYSNFLNQLLQKNTFRVEPEYSFLLPAATWNDRKGVLGYDISIESIKNRYFIIFADALAKKGYTRGKLNSLWMIYDKKSYIQEKTNFEDELLAISIEENLPFHLTQTMFLLTNQNPELTKKILQNLKQYQEYFATSEIKTFLKREFIRTDKDSMQGSLIKILGAKIYQDLCFCLERDQHLSRAIIDYILYHSEDIEYSIPEKTLIKKKENR